jgi:hypothetical protein
MCFADHDAEEIIDDSGATRIFPEIRDQVLM